MSRATGDRGVVDGGAGAEVPARFRELEASWRPDEQVREDEVAALSPTAFAALLDQPTPVTEPGDPLPPLWHWLLFPEVLRSDELGADGHPRESALVPPLPNRRRVFGGGTVQWFGLLRCGDRVRRVSRVRDVRTRVGGSGPLLIVTVVHELSVSGEVRVVESQDLIYREADAATRPARDASRDRVPPGAVLRDDPRAAWSISVEVDPVLLFRFSALTWNAHRIHYDEPYATRVEGHPGLVVHGPLLALLLLEVPRRHLASRRLDRLSWRMRRPVHARQPVLVRGAAPTAEGELALWASTDTATESVTATARLERT
jgi:hydroxyacyl-ACP dehydratase HTD2-like protein with hotdog domain